MTTKLIGMEAATASGSSPLARDGAVPAAPSARARPQAGGRDAIDGVARCTCCERFPLVGETVVHHRGSKGGGWVCERCEAAGRGERIGRAESSVRIRSFGGAMNVRRAV
jgi:hypothetical protein